ncbi:MAG TPA: EamA family transporter [Anaerolineales bacterium]|nr:EamA family transporter [Anaerolineales bacterium]
MSGALWAVTAGVGFGLFQTVNRRGVRGMDVYLATFVQLAVSTGVLAAASLATQDVSRLWLAPPGALANFAMAGFFHFFIGWTFLNASQKRIGAARTSPLIGTTPLFAAAIAALTLGEIPEVLTLGGIALMVAGVYVVSGWSNGNGDGGGNPKPASASRNTSVFGLSAAFCWALSPYFIRAGLEELPSPLLGVTVGVAASAGAYGLVLLWQRGRWAGKPVTGEAWLFKLMAGVLVGLSTWARWIALDLAPVAVVLALSMVSVPLVILLSPFVSGRQQERVTLGLWIGAVLIVVGALTLILLT